MNKKAKQELIELISGLVMISVGLFLFTTKARVESDYLSLRGGWTWWKLLLSVLPLIAGIVMMIVRPKLKITKILAFLGILIITIILFIDTTIIIKAGVHPIEWIMGIVLMALGFIVCVIALLVNTKK